MLLHWYNWLDQHDPADYGWDEYDIMTRTEYLRVTGVIPTNDAPKLVELYRALCSGAYPTMFRRGNGLRYKMEMDFGIYRAHEFWGMSYLEWIKQDAGVALIQLDNLKGYRGKDVKAQDSTMADAERKLKDELRKAGL